MTAPATDVAIPQLTVYIILLPLIAYLLYAHGKHGLLGYIYLFLFCALQLISAGLQIASSKSTTAAILSSVGLSPLLLALAGVVHEAHTYLSRPKAGNATIGWVFQLLLHLLTIAAVVLVAIGTSDLTHDAAGTSEYNCDLKHRKVGSILLLVALLAIAAHATWVFLKYLVSTNAMARRLLSSAILAMPLVFARLVYTIVYSFASPSSHTFHALNPVTASIAIRVILIFLLPLLAVLSLIVGALLSRHLPREGDGRRGQGSEDYRFPGELQDFAQK